MKGLSEFNGANKRNLMLYIWAGDKDQVSRTTLTSQAADPQSTGAFPLISRDVGTGLQPQ